MTRNILIVSLFTMLAYTSYAQTTYTVQFKNGETKQVTVNYDDHNKIPRYRVGTSFFNISHSKEPAFSFYVKPEFRMNEKLIIDGRANFAISRGLDGNIEDYYGTKELRHKTFKNFNVVAHYSIWSDINTRLIKQAFDWVYNGSQVTVYVGELPRNFYRSLELDIGLSTVTHTSDIIVSGAPVPPNNSDYDYAYYLTGTHSSISLQYGLSFYKAQAVEMKTNNKTRSYFTYQRFYLNLLSALSNNTDYYHNIHNRVDKDIVLPVDEGVLTPDKKVNLGYRAGGEIHLGQKNSGTSSWFGVEIGQIPYLEFGQRFTAKNLLIFHFGFAFGPKPGK